MLIWNERLCGMSAFQLTTNLVSDPWKTNGLEFVGAAGFSNVWEAVTHKVPTLGKDQQFIRLKIEKD